MGDIALDIGSDSWLIKANLLDKSWYERYISCVYFSILTMVTAGIADIQEPIQRTFSLFIVITLAGVFAYSISTIGIILQDMDKLGESLKFKFLIIFYLYFYFNSISNKEIL